MHPYQLVVQGESEAEQLNAEGQSLQSAQEVHVQAIRLEDTVKLQGMMGKSSSSKLQKRVIIGVGAICLAALCLFILFYGKVEQEPSQPSSTNQHMQSSQQQNRLESSATAKPTVYSTTGLFPPIIWVYTGLPQNSTPMMTEIAANTLISQSLNKGYNGRRVDQLSAYDLLSAETVERIRKAKHTARIDNPVDELIQTALLMQHGGFMVNLSRVLILQSVHTVVKQIEKSLAPHKFIEVGLLNSSGLSEHSLDVIVAKPQSILLTKLFNQMCKVFSTAQWSYPTVSSPKIIIENTNVTHFSQLAFHLLQGILLESLQNQNLAESLQKHHSYLFPSEQLVMSLPDSADSILPNKSRSDLHKKFGNGSLLIMNLQKLQNQFNDVIGYKSHKDPIKGTVLAEILSLKTNQWLLSQKYDRRQKVQFCIISLKPLKSMSELAKISHSLTLLENQSYQQWKNVFFVSNLTDSSLNLNVHDKNIIVVNASEYEGLNLQRAVVQHCSQKDIGLILNYDQKFGSDSALQEIAKNFHEKQTSGVITTVKVKDKVHTPPRKPQYIERKLNEVKKQPYQQARNLYRAFRVEFYRWLSGYSLHDLEGRYYNRQIAFMNMIEAGHRGECDYPGLSFWLRLVERKMAVPSQVSILNKVEIISPEFEKVDGKKVEYYSKFKAYDFCQSVQKYSQLKRRNIQDMVVFNQGTEFKGISSKKKVKNGATIPKKIHQIWIGDPKSRPASKVFLSKRLKEYYHDFEYRLWTEKDITRENFPATYDILQTLYEFNKVSPYNKYSIMSDLMRFEIIYNHGGFYFDNNFLILKKGFLNRVLNYSLVVTGFMQGWHRTLHETSFFGAIKHYAPLQRLIDHRSLSTRNFYSQAANEESGPNYFSWLEVGEEELQQDRLYVPQEVMYPHAHFYPPAAPNLCEAGQKTPKNSILFTGKRSYRKDCDKKYPYAVAIDLFDEGGTWVKKKETSKTK